MEYLVPLIETEPPGSALRYAFNACAFALLGNRARADGLDLAQLSLKEHTLALAQTHKALGHPAAASTDGTLAAVLLLCLYEVCLVSGSSKKQYFKFDCVDVPVFIEHNSHQGEQNASVAFAY
jgi:hypothetical protein